MMKKALCWLVRIGCWAYLSVLGGWLALYLLTGESFAIMAMIDYLAVYLFLPLPLVLLGAVVCSSRSLGSGFALGVIVYAWIWGALFMPRLDPPRAKNPTLTVMTYNVLAWHTHTRPILDTIRAEDPDIVLIQELNWTLARQLEEQLGEVYPYQVLEPEDDPRGIGTISKYPIRLTGERLPGDWVGGPQMMTLDWNGEKVTLVNFHMWPTTGVRPLSEAERSIRLRETEARQLAQVVVSAGTAIVGGDANCSSLSAAYRILTRDLSDAYQEAGFGLGHTFPGSDIPESDRPHIGGWYVPQWLARIDYVFHTGDWETLSARVARFDGVSDHRGVVAVLQRKEDTSGE
jgi:endonuclease/exonuclease/phosphatase (EEP) superfamily protein YafD